MPQTKNMTFKVLDWVADKIILHNYHYMTQLESLFDMSAE